MFFCCSGNDLPKIQAQISGLSDESSEVRYKSTKALHKLAVKHPMNAAIIRAEGGILLLVNLWNTDDYEPTREMAQAVLTACVTTLSGHEAPVVSLAPLSGDRLASGDRAGVIKIWDLTLNQCVRTLTEHTGSVRALAVLPDERLVSGSNDHSIKIWNLVSGRCEGTLSGHEACVTSLAVLRDGRIASGSFDMSIRVWNAASMRLEKILTGHTDYVMCLATLTDGRLASGSGDREQMIKIWNVVSGNCEATLDEDVTALAALSDGRLATGGAKSGFGGASFGGMIRIWNLISQQSEETLEAGNSVNSVKVLLDGRLVYSCADSIRILNVATGQCDVIDIENGGGNLAILQDGRLVSGSNANMMSEDNSIRIWDITARAELLPSPEARI